MGRAILVAFGALKVSAQKSGFALLILALICTGTFYSSQHSFAQDGVPDLSGIWRRDSFRLVPPYMFDDGVLDGVIDGFDNPILKPWTAEILMQKSHNEANWRIAANTMATCWPYGVPGVFDVRGIQILQLPDEVLIIYVIDHQVRQIPLNVGHSNPVEPGWYGESVAHFEGDTLVVDTIGFHDRIEAMVDAYGTPVTEALHVVERYRLIEDGANLEVEVYVEDPNVFKTSWSMTVEYYSDDVPLREAPCAENNRDLPELMPTATQPDF